MTDGDMHAESGFALAVEEIENLNHAVNVPDALNEIYDPIAFIQDTLYALSEITRTFESLQTIVARQRFKVRVGDLFVNDCTIDSSPVITLGNLGHVFVRDEATRIVVIVRRYLKQTATLQPFRHGDDTEESV